MQERVLVFDVWGDYAHFRKNYSTSSPLTYSFPPRTVLSGLIGAIAGLEKTEYFRQFFRDDARIGCRIMKPVKKVRIGENLVDTKSAIKMHLIKNRTQIRFEFLKDPNYRIYFSHSDEKFFGNLRDLLEKHQSVFTPCLGLSQLICNFRFVGEFETISEGGIEESQTIDSVVPGKCILEPEFEDGKEYFSEVMPCEMGAERVVMDFREILFERNGKSIRAKAKDLWVVENGEPSERIAFL
ncbi:MAG TPA: type I-B CRISPR-associated protein Cas5b [Methanothrix sp.]|nr:type I-B CRISPR-associated protein Cas5b [Methanothrix sp.]